MVVFLENEVQKHSLEKTVKLNFSNLNVTELPLKKAINFITLHGGGGCGDPFTREPERVHFDVDAGLVTREGAKENYGVVLRKDLSINKAATVKLRAEKTKARGKVKLFDKGFSSIKELKARCKDETGLEAPADPKFQKWMTAS